MLQRGVLLGKLLLCDLWLWACCFCNKQHSGQACSQELTVGHYFLVKYNWMFKAFFMLFMLLTKGWKVQAFSFDDI